ncbi:MAG TPA: SEC-C metal-binding domain-containing protein [Solirubrobacteraceae bacterium]|nr:SEC-C metal-binding domain-containing protein [Solirubrobacteraceae bacterium]
MLPSLTASSGPATARPVTAVTPGAAAARGVLRLTGPLYARILDLDKPTRYEAFDAFCCGDPDTEKAVGEVQLTAQRLRTGMVELAQTPVVVEDEAGRLVGYCSVHSRSRSGYPDGHLRPWIAERYVVAVGRDLDHRKCLLRDGVTRVGEILLRAGLDMIALEAEGRPMPEVSALVRSENVDSQRLFDAFDFLCLPATATGFTQDLRWRHAGTPLPPPPGPDVYVPPERPVPTPANVGRNDPCPCGSGRKYKRCCGP